MDKLNEITNDMSVLVVMNEHAYDTKTPALLQQLHESRRNFCYVCLARPYSEIKERFQSSFIPTTQFHFIDTLSSHYEKQEEQEDCTFLPDPIKLSVLSETIMQKMKEKRCSGVVFDTFSALLSYKADFELLHFINDLSMKTKDKNMSKILFFERKIRPYYENSERLANDLALFLDRTIWLNGKETHQTHPVQDQR
ncbi:MAG: hypothetical protein GXP63_04950 [DPANN group archaeon]|nr:hypothetical protein [DPANN group archaeon]